MKIRAVIHVYVKYGKDNPVSSTNKTASVQLANKTL